MIIVTGDVTLRAGTVASAVSLSLDHVHRSRAEPGCLSHDVAIDAENPLRLLFVERWQDLAALHTHFAVPETRGFARALGELAASPGSLRLYQATDVTTG